MPFARPTLTQLIQQVKQNIMAALPGADAMLRFSNLGVLGKVQAGLAHQHYGYLDYIAQQATPYTATDEYLAAWGALKGVTQKAAKQAGGIVTFPAASGTVTIASGTLVTRSDGTEYSVVAVTQLTGASISVSVLAKTDPTGQTGAFGNCDSGTQFTLGQTISGITSAGVSGLISGGADLESTLAYRERVVAAYQATAQGGAQGDYVRWAMQVPGVTRAWCAPLMNGAGTVGVYVMFDGVRAAQGGVPHGSNGVATLEARGTAATGDQLIVANYIYPLRPVTALVFVIAPTLTPVPVRVSGVSEANQAAVTTALQASLYASQSVGGTVELKTLWAAVQSAAPNDDFVITSPQADVQMGSGCVPVLGTVTWI